MGTPSFFPNPLLMGAETSILCIDGAHATYMYIVYLSITEAGFRCGTLSGQNGGKNG